MIALLAATLFASAPNAAALAPRFVQVQEAAPAEQPTVNSYAGWTREQLVEERVRLELVRPGLGMPIGIIAAGGGAFVIDAVILLWGGFLALFGATFSPVTIGVIIVFAVLGSLGVGAGIYLLLPVLKERSAVGAQMDQVDALLEEHPTAPPAQPDPGPGLQPPLQIQLSAPASRVLLARF
jgi:hypothetical protein